MSSLLEIKGITKTFSKEKGLFSHKTRFLACDNINLTLEKGKILGIVGESGSGKSTLGKIIVRLLKEDSGEIIYKGRNLCEISRKEFNPFRKEIQMIFQNPYLSLNPSKTIGWLMGEGMDIEKGFSKEDKNSQIKKMMDMVGLRANLMKRYPHELSGGERQRAAIGIALMQNPKIVVADEAVSALDVSVSAQILNLLNELKSELDLSYIFISHDLNVVNFLSDDIAVMKMGKIVEYGTAEQIFNHPAHEYTKILIEAFKG